ncbi:hypothetical protein MTR67_042438 [Solanum verrucosum]|uniref:Uncharacterized protein n=1 Tax=Solanum verrucosum TaxID=315347 RepID=A0AAF0ZTD7_SOLVR|nr:hypothetical protein MTR67_042438 [Solanum verrucosum]
MYLLHQIQIQTETD